MNQDGIIQKITAIPVIILFCVQILIFTVVRDPAINDVFHLGEFTTSALAIIYNPSGSWQPFTIHGALNFWPYLIVESISPDSQHVISYSLVLIQSIAQIGAMLFTLLIALRLAKLFSLDLTLMIPFIFFAGGFAVGHKEIFFLICLYMLTFSVNHAQRGGVKAVVFFCIFGLIAALGVYWSFDRGLATVGCVGFSLLVIAYRYKLAFVAVISFGASFLVLPYIVPGIGVIHYFENILLLFRTAENWRYENTDWSILTYIILINIAAVLVGLNLIFRQNQINQKSISILALSLGAILFFKIGTNRLDLGHYISSLWIPLAIFALAAPKTAPIRSFKIAAIATIFAFFALICSQIMGVDLQYPNAVSKRNIGILYIILMLIPIIVGVMAQLGSSGVGRYITSLFSAFTLIVSGVIVAISVWHGARNLQGDTFLSGIINLPPDSELVGEDMRWLAESISETDASCLFDFTNMGIVNGLTKLPPCTQYSYIVYGDSDDEARILSQLQESAPPVVLYSSQNWHYTIDGKSMRDRFPLIEAYMLKSYPKEICNYGHCLRFKSN
jgi:hypothetical protein